MLEICNIAMHMTMVLHNFTSMYKQNLVHTLHKCHFFSGWRDVGKSEIKQLTYTDTITKTCCKCLERYFLGKKCCFILWKWMSYRFFSSGAFKWNHLLTLGSIWELIQSPMGSRLPINSETKPFPHSSQTLFLAWGAIHFVRTQNFRDFWPPPPPLYAFWPGL